MGLAFLVEFSLNIHEWHTFALEIVRVCIVLVVRTAPSVAALVARTAAAAVL